MPLVDFVGLGDEIEVFFVVVFILVDDSDPDVGLYGVGLEFDYSLEACPSHFIFSQIEETVGHTDAGLGGEALAGLETFLVEIQGFVVILSDEVDLGQHQHRSHQ